MSTAVATQTMTGAPALTMERAQAQRQAMRSTTRVLAEGALLALALGALLAPSGRVPAPGGLVLVGEHAITRGGFQAFPVLCRTPRGLLVGAYFRGTGDGSPDGRFVVRTSRDDGHTWRTPVSPFAVPAGWASAQGSVLCLPGGRLLLAAVLTDGRTIRQPWLSASDDAGRTWTAPRRLPRGFRAWTFVDGTGLATAAGLVLLPAYGQDRGDPGLYGPLHNRTGLYRSTDAGRTFRFVRLSGPSLSLNEMSLVALPHGVVRAYLRDESAPQGSRLWSAQSQEGGRAGSWSRPQPIRSFTAAPGMPAPVYLPRAHTLVLFYRAPADYGTAYRVSRDGGRHWSAEQRLAGGYEYAALVPDGPAALLGLRGTNSSAHAARVLVFRLRPSYPGPASRRQAAATTGSAWVAPCSSRSARSSSACACAARRASRSERAVAASASAAASSSSVNGSSRECGGRWSVGSPRCSRARCAPQSAQSTTVRVRPMRSSCPVRGLN